MLERRLHFERHMDDLRLLLMRYDRIRSEEHHPISRVLMRLYAPVATWALRRPPVLLVRWIPRLRHSHFPPIPIPIIPIPLIPVPFACVDGVGLPVALGMAPIRIPISMPFSIAGRDQSKTSTTTTLLDTQLM